VQETSLGAVLLLPATVNPKVAEAFGAREPL
jgi:hypothetical protein